jgi:hypothetical protein
MDITAAARRKLAKLNTPANAASRMAGNPLLSPHQSYTIDDAMSLFILRCTNGSDKKAKHEKSTAPTVCKKVILSPERFRSVRSAKTIKATKLIMMPIPNNRADISRAVEIGLSELPGNGLQKTTAK